MWIIHLLIIILFCCQRCCGYQNNWLLRQVRVFVYFVIFVTQKEFNLQTYSRAIYCIFCCLIKRYYVWLGQAGQDHQLKMDHNMDKMIKYFAVDMEDMENFDFHLRRILIPRVPGTVGNKLVREVRTLLRIAPNYFQVQI